MARRPSLDGGLGKCSKYARLDVIAANEFLPQKSIAMAISGECRAKPYGVPRGIASALAPGQCDLAIPPAATHPAPPACYPELYMARWLARRRVSLLPRLAVGAAAAVLLVVIVLASGWPSLTVQADDQSVAASDSANATAQPSGADDASVTFRGKIVPFIQKYWPIVTDATSLRRASP